METSKVISTDKATVVIQVNPQVISDDGQEARGAYHNTALAEFFKAQPKALGAVQIMTGVMVFLFGIVRTTSVLYNYYPAFSVISGITYWGSFVYISAGALSVAAQNKLHLCVVKASLIMNVISAITAGLAILLVSIEIGLISEQRCYNVYDSSPHFCFNFKRYDLGVNGILLVFSILQFIISIWISAFACKATSNNDSTVVNVALNQGKSKTLPRMETSKVISTDKATVVIQVNPQVICDDGQEARGAYHTFLKAQPKALGAVQIITGVMVFLFGIVRTMMSTISLLFLCLNISAGALSVAAQNKPNPCVVNSSLVMNVLSAVTAGLAILLISMEIGLGSETSKYQSCYKIYDQPEDFMCLKYDLGILGILLVFSILQFIISIWISAFACKATSNNDSTMVNVALIGWNKSSNPEPWNQLSPGYQYKFVAINTDYKNLKKEGPDF
ncbi:unnamed protein product [Leuciscus chuanchicus]